MPSCDLDDPKYTTEVSRSDTESQSSGVPDEIELYSEMDYRICTGFWRQNHHVDSTVRARYNGDYDDVESISIRSEVIIDGIEVSASAGSGGAGGSFSVTSNSIIYNGDFDGDEAAEYNGFDLEGSSLASTSVKQRDSAVFRINGSDYKIDTVHNINTLELSA